MSKKMFLKDSTVTGRASVIVIRDKLTRDFAWKSDFIKREKQNNWNYSTKSTAFAVF